MHVLKRMIIINSCFLRGTEYILVNIYSHVPKYWLDSWPWTIFLLSAWTGLLVNVITDKVDSYHFRQKLKGWVDAACLILNNTLASHLESSGTCDRILFMDLLPAVHNIQPHLLWWHLLAQIINIPRSLDEEVSPWQAVDWALGRALSWTLWSSTQEPDKVCFVPDTGLCPHQWSRQIFLVVLYLWSPLLIIILNRQFQYIGNE